ncbi:MAG TPA: trehalase family glycosidase [Kiritimatiellia bacterium]|nr:trehalase family glycosidase [Kiritimatiellia bacterium]HRZ11323.1 trehalase family glycosidase [Kiritimatiellia bacterium]HSA17126.1 trehalase family glycosidase [Kiritimatiellia bacterium]
MNHEHPLPPPGRACAETQFTDLFSRFGVSLDVQAAGPGLSRGHLASQREGKTFAAPLLAVSLTGENGEPLRRGACGQQWFPWGVVQECAWGVALRLRLTVVYAAPDVAALHAEIANAGPRDEIFMVALESRLAPGDVNAAARFDATTNTAWLEAVSRPTSRWTIRDEPDFRLAAGIRPLFAVASAEAAAGLCTVRSALLAVGRGDKASLAVLVSAAARDLSVPDAAAPRALVEARLEQQARRGLLEILAEARQRWRAVEARLPLADLEEECRDLARLSAVILLKNTLRPQPEQGYGGAMGGHLGTFPARGFYEAFWIWDSAKQARGFLEFDLELARENILVMLDRQDEATGQLVFLQPDASVPSAQPPLFSWVTQELARKDPAAAPGFLAQVYPRLAKWHRWWQDTRDRDGDGLAEWPDNLASGWDDSPRWDTGRQAGVGNDGGAPAYAAVDLNAFLIADARHLAAMAGPLGRVAEARNWNARAEALSARVLAKLYDAEDNLFYDARGDTGLFNRVKTTACFMPLWAGVPLAPEKIRDMLERYLLNERHFFGRFPFPCVAYSEPRFDPAGASGYWRGPVWLDQAFFMLSILDRYRRLLGPASRDSADLARRRILDMVLRAGIHENYHALTGAPGANSREHFSWSAAAVLAIALRRYEES